MFKKNTLLIIVIVLIIVLAFVFPKPSGWSNMNRGVKVCDCIGYKTLKPWGMRVPEARSYSCFGIPLNCRLYTDSPLCRTTADTYCWSIKHPRVLNGPIIGKFWKKHPECSDFLQEINSDGTCPINK